MEFKVDNKTYVARKLNAVKQFHIMRRLAPVMNGIFSIISDLKGGNFEDLINEDASRLEPFMDCIAKLSDEDSEYCIFGMLECVQVKLDKGLGKSDICYNNVLADSNMTLMSMMTIVFNAIAHNFGDYINLPQLLSDFSEAKTEINK